ncbi:MAG: ankyrin repeat domain-containing protein, partial [Spirochaetia bacterium]|nr:ankyrin repeat domain-containing protein [Spirochaetia bacterium]
VFDTIFLPVTVTRAVLDQSEKSKQDNKKQHLVDAVRNGETEKISILLSDGISPDLAVSENNDKIYDFPESSFYENAVPILYLAYQNHHINAAKILLEKKAVTWPASKYAILKKNKNIIHAMISNGISADEFYEYSVRHDSLDMADFALSRGANVNLLSLWDENQGGEFPVLFYFIKNKNKNGVVWFLKKKGIRLNFTDHFGSALHYSVRQEDPELVRILTKSDINRNLKDNRGRTARQLAEKISDNSLREEILKYL